MLGLWFHLGVFVWIVPLPAGIIPGGAQSTVHGVHMILNPSFQASPKMLFAFSYQLSIPRYTLIVYLIMEVGAHFLCYKMFAYRDKNIKQKCAELTKTLVLEFHEDVITDDAKLVTALEVIFFFVFSLYNFILQFNQ